MAHEGSISVALPFSETACGRCRGKEAVGVCSLDRREADKVGTNALHAGCRDALSGMAMRVHALETTLECTPARHIACTELQFGAALGESDLQRKTQRVSEVYRQLHGMDVRADETVSTSLSECLLRLIEQVEAVVQEGRRLMWLDPPATCHGLPEMLNVLSRGAVNLAHETVDALVAIRENGSPGSVDLSGLLKWLAEFECLCRRLEMLHIDSDSVDCRVGRAFGLAGSCSDGHGRLDIARVLAADVDPDAPLREVAGRATTYLNHVIHDARALGVKGAVLALPAVTLACLDRPLIGHLVAFELSKLLWRALAVDSEGTLILVRRTLETSPRLLASLAQTERPQTRISPDEEELAVDAVADLIGLYVAAAEASFRDFCVLALGLECLARGEEVSDTSNISPLGDIITILVSSSGDLAGLLAEAVGVDKALPGDASPELTGAMVACVAGMDAAMTAWGLESGLLLADSSSRHDAVEGEDALVVIARCLLLVSGGELLAVNRGPVVTLTARVKSPYVRARFLQVLDAISALLPGCEELEVRDEYGALIVAAFRESFARHRASCPDTSPITALYSLFDAAVSLDEDRELAAQDAVSVMIRLLAPNDVDGNARNPRAVMLHRVAVRAVAIRTFIATHSLGPPRLDDKFTALLRRAEGAAMAAAHGDQGAFSRMLKALDPLFRWTECRTASFNVLFQPC